MKGGEMEGVDYSTLLIETKLNEHAKIKLALVYRMLELSDDFLASGLIEKEKASIYKAMKLTHVPHLEIFSAYLDETEQNKELFRFLGGNPDSSEYGKGLNPEGNIPDSAFRHLLLFIENSNYGPISRDAGVFEMISDALSDNRYNLGLAWGEKKPKLSNGLFVYNYDNDPQQEILWTASSIKEWKKMKSLGNLQKFFSRKTVKTKIQARFQGWSNYIERNLFQREESRLFQGGGNRRQFSIGNYSIRVVDMDNQRSLTSSILLQYRKDNPDDIEEPDTISLSNKPAFEYLPDRKCLSFIAVDNTNGKMAGYICCSLKTATLTREGETPYNIPELDRLNRQLRENKERKTHQGMAFDIFAIDGIHIDKNYRGQGIKPRVGISKVLVFSALELVRLTHMELGVKMVMALSLAAQTKQILVSSFSFHHYNKHQLVIWIKGHFDEYYALITNKGQPNPNPKLGISPPQFLSFKIIHKDLNTFREEFFPPFVESDTRHARTEVQEEHDLVDKERRISIDSLIEALNSFLVEYKEFPIVNEIGQLPVSLTTEMPVDDDTLLELYTKMNHFWFVMGRTQKEEDELAKIRGFIGVGPDVDDTFLSLSGPEYNLFEQEMLSFLELMNKPLPPVVEKPQEQPASLDDTDIAYNSQAVKISTQQAELVNRIPEPTEEDMLLYAILEGSFIIEEEEEEEGEDVIHISIEDTEPGGEEEKEEGDDGIQRLEVSIREMSDQLEGKMRRYDNRLKEIEELEREWRMIYDGIYEMNFGRLLLCQ